MELQTKHTNTMEKNIHRLGNKKPTQTQHLTKLQVQEPIKHSKINNHTGSDKIKISVYQMLTFVIVINLCPICDAYKINIANLIEVNNY